MTDIPEKIIEIAARNIYGYGWDDTFDANRNAALEDARLALEVAGPHIAAQTLRNAAREAEEDELTTAGEVVKDLRRSADKLEARA